jgi:hypothetical protein
MGSSTKDKIYYGNGHLPKHKTGFMETRISELTRDNILDHPNVSDYCCCNYMALIERWAYMISNRERNAFNADLWVPGFAKSWAPKSDNLSFIIGRIESSLVAEARLQRPSGGEAIPPQITLLTHQCAGVQSCAHTRKADASALTRTLVVHYGRYKSDLLKEMNLIAPDKLSN